jgi:predicted PurR-regulated permease PerM
MTRFSTALFLLFFTIVAAFNVYLFLPLLNSLVFAGILAGAFYPVHCWLQHRLKLRETLAATLTTMMVVVLILLPLIYILIQVSKEAYAYYLTLQVGIQDGGIYDFFFGDGLIGSLITRSLTMFEIPLTNDELYRLLLQRLQGLSGLLFGTINAWMSNTLSFMFSFVVMILAVWGIFMQGEQLKIFLFDLSPLPNEQEEQILIKFNQMNFAILIGNGVGGVIQGVLAGIGLWLLGVPSVFLWTTLMVILAFIPLLGISLITIPVAIITFLSGQQLAAIIFIIYTTTVAMGVENWFKPHFIGSRVKVNSLLLLFYIIGGMGAFGVVGIFYGPILAIIFLTMSDIYTQNYLPRLQKNK